MLLGDDLDDIMPDEGIAVAHSLIPVTHSIGSVGALDAERDVDAIFMINPYLGPEFLAKPQRALLYLTRLFTYTGIHKPLQSLLSIKNYSQKFGFHNKRFLGDYAKLLSVPRDYHFGKKIGFYVSDRDEVLGTLNNNKHYNFVRNKLKTTFSQAQDYSWVVKGLNHCLNKNKGDLAPFLKPEQGKDSDKIVRTIIDFYHESLKK